MINIITFRNGILDTNELFVSPEEAETRFKELARKIEPSLNENELNAALDDGNYDNNNGREVIITTPILK